MAKKKNAEILHWHRLDNTANLFPVVTTKKFTNVFRLSVVLDEDIRPALLEQALRHVLPFFPAFNVRLRHGLFWHYLEANPETPSIALEDDYPCRYIDPRQNNNFLFKVSYYEQRINLETFHVLTDGTGSLQFLLALCCRYLILAKPGAFTPEQASLDWFTGHAKNTEDSYVANYARAKKKTFLTQTAFHIKGERNYIGCLGVVHAYIPSGKLLALCHEKDVTVTQYLCACILWGIYQAQQKGRGHKRPVSIFLPVNLRNLFESQTTLNFFSNIYISFLFNRPGITFDEVLYNIKQQFGDKINRESIQERISYTVGSGYSPFVRAVPLPLKKAVLRLIFEASSKGCTLGFSNLGVVKLPPPFAPHVQNMAFFFSTSPREPLKIGSISCNGNLTLTFTSTLRNTDVQKAIVRKMVEDGLEICVEGNGVENESL